MNGPKLDTSHTTLASQLLTSLMDMINFSALRAASIHTAPHHTLRVFTSIGRTVQYITRLDLLYFNQCCTATYLFHFHFEPYRSVMYFVSFYLTVMITLLHHTQRILLQSVWRSWPPRPKSWVITNFILMITYIKTCNLTCICLVSHGS